MAITVNGSLMDLCVLSLAAREDLYGYKLTQQMKALFDISESSLYPVLRRLTKAGLLKTYDLPHDGRMRRYYALTDSGFQALSEYREEWESFAKKINDLVEMDVERVYRRLEQ